MTGAQYAALLGLWIAGIVVPGPDIFIILRNAFLSSRRSAVFTALGVMVGNLAWITLSLLGVTVFISGNHVLKLVVQIGGALFLVRMGYGAIRAGLAARSRAAVGPSRVVASTEPGASGADDDVATAVGAPHASQRLGAQSSGHGEVASPLTPGPAAQPPTDPLMADDAAVAEEIAAGGRTTLLGASGLTPLRALVQGTVTNLANAKAVVFFVALFGSVVPAGLQWWEGLTALGMLVAVGLAWFLAVAWLGSVPALARRFRARSAEVEIVSGVVFVLVALGLFVEAVLTV